MVSSKKVGVSLLVLYTAVLFLALVGQAGSTAQAAQQLPANPDWPFVRIWERTDLPVAINKAPRSWYWGPAPFAITTESYSDAPGGTRRVSYYDKSRMEITNPSGDLNSKYYVTNGLLVKELVTGQMQLGDNQFQTRQPANIPVSGDSLNNSVSPTYASFGSLLSSSAQTTGPVTATLDQNGNVSSDASLATSYPETAIAYYDSNLGHNIPNVLWNFMNLQGIVSVNKQLVNDKVEDWVYSFGLPITEPYWTQSVVAGVQKDVLVQLFERRVLTYTPSNPSAFQVEMGNVGQHYYNWRYNLKPSGAANYTQPAISIAIPAIGVKANIEYVGQKNDGTMDIPSNPFDVAYYRYGSYIGGPGNAVIAGHLDYYNIPRAIFYNISSLSPGDEVDVTTSGGTQFRFGVTAVKIYSNSQFPLDAVFGNTNQHNLNLITCEGDFDPNAGQYNNRLVVYTTLIQ